MKFYTKVFILSISLIIGGNIFYIKSASLPVTPFFLWLLSSILVCGLSSGIITLITRMLPRKWFNPFSKRFKVYSKENKIYLKLKIKKWKDKIPELGKLSGFPKDKIEKPDNSEYLYKFLTETCLAETLHFFSIISGSLVFFILPRTYIFTIGVPIFILNMFIHLLPVLVQRYVRPKLIKMYSRMKKIEEKDEEELVKTN